MIVGLDALVLIVGLLMYALSANPKLVEIGRTMFWCGLLALLLSGERVVAMINGR